MYPRELVKSALARNAAAIAVAHNHPSGQAEPSRADEFLTQTLKSALALVDMARDTGYTEPGLAVDVLIDRPTATHRRGRGRRG